MSLIVASDFLKWCEVFGIQLNGGGGNLPSGVASSVLVTNASGMPLWQGPLTDGQLIIGSTDGTPVPGSLLEGDNITITPGDGTITISSTGTGSGVTPQQVQRSTFNYSAGNYTAGNYVVTLTPAVTVLTDGLLVTMIASDTNATTSPTLQLNALSPKPIVSFEDSPAVGDILADSAYLLVYSSDNDNFQLLNPSLTASNSYLVQKQYYNFGIDIGAVNAYEVNLTLPPLVSLSDGMTVYLHPANSNTGPSTIVVNGSAATDIVNLDGSPLTAGEIVGSSLHMLMYSVDDGEFILMTPYISLTSTINTISGDAGSASGNTINIVSGLSSRNSGISVSFTGDNASTLTLNVTDDNDNTLIGRNSGSLSVPGEFNTGVGSNCLGALSSGNNNAGHGWNALASMQDGSGNIGVGPQSLQSSVSDTNNIGIGFESLFTLNGGSNNLGLGSFAMYSLMSGNYNVGIGSNSGVAYVSSESSNILINSSGVVGDNNILRIGNATGTDPQSINAAYICGIDGTNVGNVSKVVTMASDQLGTAVLTAGPGININPTANTITITSTATNLAWSTIVGTTQNADVNNGYVTSNILLTSIQLPALCVVGDVVSIRGYGIGGWILESNTGQNIILGAASSSTGGALASTNNTDTVDVRCIVINTVWTVESSVSSGLTIS